MADTWKFLLIYFSICKSWVYGGGIKGPPVVHKHERLLTFLEGKQIKLPCPITAIPEPLFEWTKDGESIDESWPRYYIRRHFLRIKATEAEDSGEFTCTGVNGFGKATFTFSVVIYGGDIQSRDQLQPPSFYEAYPNSPISRQIGEEVTITCRAQGSPQPVISWYKDGISLRNSGSKFYLSSVTPGDAGIYSCVAKNPLAVVTTNFTLKVEEHLWDHDMTILGMTNTTVREGDNATMQCLVRSPITPEMQWFKLLTRSEYESMGSSIRNTTLIRDGKMYLHMTPPGYKQPMGNMTYMVQLHIMKAHPKDTGIYVCVGATTKGYNFQEVALSVVPDTTLSENTINLMSSDMGWLFLFLPLVVVVILATIGLVLCQVRKSPEKPLPPIPPVTSSESENPTVNTPLKLYHPSSKENSSVPPDLIYQDSNGYIHKTSYQQTQDTSNYPEIYYYPESSYMDPNYSDPYLEIPDGPRLRFDPACSEHSYARLTQSTSSTSPLPPPPYGIAPSHLCSPHMRSQSRFTNSSYVQASPREGYVVHFNL